MYDISALYEAATVQDAVALRQAHPQAKLIAGGTDVLVQVRSGKLAGCELISIHGIDALRGVTLQADGTIAIGSLTTFTELTRDPIIQAHIPVLGQAVDHVGGPQIRSAGTIGGNTCNGVTSADSASTLFALDAQIELTGPEGKRVIPIADFYFSAGVTDVRPGELQTAISIPQAAYEGYFGHYIRYAMREALDISLVNCSVNVKLSGDKTAIADVRAAYGVTGPVPMRVPGAEAAIRGKAVCEETVADFAAAVLSEIHPRDSWRASKAFREHIAAELAQRCLRQSICLAGGAF